ncbi:High-affinity Fe2+/Pb2+ permease, partial [Paenibacillus sp. FSL R7-277]
MMITVTQSPWRPIRAVLLLLCLLVLLPGAPASASGAPLDELLPPVGSALVEAGQSRWAAAAADVDSFAALWRSANESKPDPALAGPAAEVDAALDAAAEALAGGGGG